MGADQVGPVVGVGDLHGRGRAVRARPFFNGRLYFLDIVFHGVPDAFLPEGMLCASCQHAIPPLFTCDRDAVPSHRLPVE